MGRMGQRGRDNLYVRKGERERKRERVIKRNRDISRKKKCDWESDRKKDRKIIII